MGAGRGAKCEMIGTEAGKEVQSVSDKNGSRRGFAKYEMIKMEAKKHLKYEMIRTGAGKDVQSVT
jgi:hypothetical protein